MKVLLKQIRIFDSNSKWHNKITNVLIEKGKIAFIGKDEKSASKVIEGEGMILSAGWVDMWASFNDPGYEHKEDLYSGKSAAAHGGFTKVCVLPNTSPVTQSKNNIKYLIKENGSDLVDVLPIAAITKNTEGAELNEMLDLHEHGAIAFSDGDNTVWNSDILLKTLQYLQKVDSLVIQKPEDTMLSHKGAMHEGKESTLLGLPGIPVLSEEIVVQRDLKILDYVGGRLHFTNLSTPQALKLVSDAKKSGLAVSSDINISQLNYSDENLVDFDTNYKVNPPFRSKTLNKEMLKHLKNGTIDVLTSAHKPQDTESKNLEFDLADFGIISIQTFASELKKLSSSIEIDLLLPMITTNPRELLKLNQPLIEEGEDAEVTLYDPNMKWKFNSNSNKSRSNNSPLWNKELIGGVRFVANNGKILFNGEE